MATLEWFDRALLRCADPNEDYSSLVADLVPDLAIKMQHTLDESQHQKVRDALFFHNSEPSRVLAAVSELAWSLRKPGNTVAMDIIGKANPGSHIVSLTNAIVIKYSGHVLLEILDGTGWWKEDKKLDAIGKCIFKLPDLIMGGLDPTDREEHLLIDFSPQEFFQARSLTVALNGSQIFQAFFVSRLMKFGYPNIVADCWKGHLGGLIDKIDQSCLSALIVAVLTSEHAETSSSNILEEIMPLSKIETSPVLRVLVLNKLLLEKLLSPSVLFALIDHIAGSPIAEEYAVAATRVWSQPRFIQSMDISRQEYITGVVFNLVAVIGKDIMESSGVTALIIAGVQNRLESSIVDIRRMGMVIGQEMAAHLDTRNPLKFEEVEDFKFKYDRTMVVVPPRVLPAKPEPVVELSTDENAPIDVFQVPRSNTISNVWNSDSSDSDDESDHSSLSPLYIDIQDTPQHDVPQYIRECMPLFQCSDFEKMSAFVDQLPELIKYNPPDLNVMAIELSSALLAFENRFNLEFFSEKRFQSLVAITVAAPSQVLPQLSVQLFMPACFLSIRYLAIDTMVAAATELSEVKCLDIPPKTITQSVGTVLRRWGRSQHAPKQSINKFASIVPLFFYAMNPRNCAPLLEREPVLLAKVVIALGTFISLARSSCHVHQVSASLLQLLLWTRFSCEACVRRATVFALTQVFIAGDMIPEGVEWMRNTAIEDPDEECRKQASLVMKSIG